MNTEIIVHAVIWTALSSIATIGLIKTVQAHGFSRRGGLWHRLAELLARPKVADWLIRRSLHTPYTHIMSPDGKRVYMARFWLFNAYSREDNKPVLRIAIGKWVLCFPISIRIHHIIREDTDRHMHSHPWNARTIILKGHYVEERPDPTSPIGKTFILRRPGSTAMLRTTDFHRICEVGPDGAWTLFISGPWRQVWTFDVDGVKVPWRKYLGMERN